MSKSIQLFVYNMPGLVAHGNNFPMIRFDTDVDAFAFISRLKSSSRRFDPTAPHFVINNTQLLPSYIRALHRYRLKKAHVIKRKSDSDSDSDSDDEYDVFDGIFIVYDNLDELKKCTIDNNTLLATGFSEALIAFNIISDSSYSNSGDKNWRGTLLPGVTLSPGDVTASGVPPPHPPTTPIENNDHESQTTPLPPTPPPAV